MQIEAILELVKPIKLTQEVNCKRCNIVIHPPKRKFCSKKCKNTFNHKELYSGKYQREYRSRTPENFIRALLDKSTRKELKKQQDTVLRIYHSQKGLCALSKVPMTYIYGQGKVKTNISLDRIDSTKGYTLDNIQFVCDIVNKMKWTSTKEELLFWCNQIITSQVKV